TIEDVFRAQMDFDRDRQKRLDALFDRAPLRPRRDDEDGVRPQQPHGIDGGRQVDLGGALVYDGGRPIGQIRGANRLQADIPRLISTHEDPDVLRGADEEDALPRYQADFASEDDGTHQQISQHQQAGQPAGMEQDHRAARIDVGHLGPEADREQEQDHHVPQRGNVPQRWPDRDVV